MNYLEGRILALEQKIATNERDYRNETDPVISKIRENY
jgi:hypothetical protein